MNRYIPNQHGAWAMLALPVLTGLAITEMTLVHIPLIAGWLIVYLFSFPVLQWVKTKKAARYKKPVIVYGSLLVPLLIAIVWLEPALMIYALLILPFFFINLFFAKSKNERALLNDLVAVFVFCSFLFPVMLVGETALWEGVSLFATLLLYFVGTVLYVKTIIRERNNPRYYKASLLFHAAAISIGFVIDPFLFVPFSILFIRAAVFPKKGLKAKQSGMIEIVFSVMIYGFVIGVFA